MFRCNCTYIWHIHIYIIRIHYIYNYIIRYISMYMKFTHNVLYINQHICFLHFLTMICLFAFMMHYVFSRWLQELPHRIWLYLPGRFAKHFRTWRRLSPFFGFGVSPQIWVSRQTNESENKAWSENSKMINRRIWGYVIFSDKAKPKHIKPTIVFEKCSD